MTADEFKPMSSYDTDSVIFEIYIPAPPPRVFKALTDQGELGRWFMDPGCPGHQWEIDARVGGRYRYFTDRQTAAAHNMTEFECHGEILELDPPRLLVYTWVASWHADKSRVTVVRWELTREGAGTQVRVRHSRLANEDAARKDYTGGWPSAIKGLKIFVEKS